MDNLLILVLVFVAVVLIIRKLIKSGILLACLIIVSIHFIKPEWIDKAIGADRHSRWSQSISENGGKWLEEGGKKFRNWLDEIEA